MFKTPVLVLVGGSVTPLAEALKQSTEEVQTVEHEAEKAGQDSTFASPAPTLPSESIHPQDYQLPGEGNKASSFRHTLTIFGNRR